MKYDKNLINDLFDIKEKLPEKDKEIVERFIAQYNHMYADYRSVQEQRYATREVYNENTKLKEQIKTYREKIRKLNNQISLGGTDD